MKIKKTTKKISSGRAKQANKKNNLMVFLFAISPAVFFPWMRDPFAIPRLTWITVCMSIILILRVTSFQVIQSQNNNSRFTKFAATAIILSVLISSIVNWENGITKNLVGDYGRLLGAVPLAIIVIAAYQFSAISNAKSMVFFLVGVTISGILYSLWNILLKVSNSNFESHSQFEGIQGLGGNVNFTSATIALSVAMSLTNLTFGKRAIFSRGLSLVSISSGLVALYISSSGIAVVTIFLALFINLFLSFRNSRFVRSSQLFGVAFLALLLLISILIFAWNDLLKEVSDSLKPRLAFWQTALNMFLENLFFGVGPDRFQDFAPRFTEGQNSFAITQNSSHNLLLDFASMFGIFSLLILVVLISRFIWYLKSTAKNNLNNEFVTLLSLTTFLILIQSLFIPIQLTFLSALLYLLFWQNTNYKAKGQQTIIKRTEFLGQRSKLVFLSIFLTIPLLLNYRLLQNDIGVRAGFASGKIDLLEKGLYSWPQFDRNFEVAIEVMSWSDKPMKKLEYARKLTDLNPLNAVGWRNIVNSEFATPDEIKKAQLQLLNATRWIGK